MKSIDEKERKLICRYDRLSDGSLFLAVPYARGVRDDSILMKRDCLAFERDLSGLSEEKRLQYLSFEEAYTKFYRLWTGSYSLPSSLSNILDFIQADMERLRREMDLLLYEVEKITTEPVSRKIKKSPDQGS